MKTLCCIVAAVGLLTAAPAMADPFNSGTAFTNLWSSAQGTSNTYGSGLALSQSTSGIAANAGGRLNGFTGGVQMTGMTTSNAATTSNGPGYAQAQTSGYTGGTVSYTSARGH